MLKQKLNGAFARLSTGAHTPRMRENAPEKKENFFECSSVSRNAGIDLIRPCVDAASYTFAILETLLLEKFHRLQ